MAKYRHRIAPVVLAVGLLLSACGGDDEPQSQSAESTTTTTAPATTAAPATTTAPPTTAPPTTAAPSSYAMPALVGQTLQLAQDSVQAASENPLFISFSRDLSGEDRSQVLDSNWKVCTQNVAPGATFTDDTRIDFGVVKLEETCP